MASTPPSSEYPSPQSQSQSPEVAPPPGRAPKLRASCDLCAAAKVKCGKEHPSCTRCAANGHECVYGPSRKHGKPGRKRKPKPESKSTTKSIANWVSTLSKDQYPELQLALEGLMNGEDYTAGGLPGKFAAESARNASYAFVDDSPISPRARPEHSASVRIGSIDTDTSSTMHPFTKSKELQGALSLTPPGTFDYQNFNEFIAGDEFPSIDTSLNASTFHHSGLNSTLLPDSPVTDHGDSTYGSCQTSIESNTHSCYNISSSTLEALNQDSTCFSAVPQSANSVFSQSYQRSSQTLDSVLRNNKAAISTVRQLLNCPCSHMPHQATLYASIVSKVLHWYQVVGGVRTSAFTSDHFMASSPNFMSPPTPPKMGSSPPSNIMFMPMTIGAFSLDEEDQEAFRQQLLLIELRKVGQVIDMFASHGSDECDSASKLYRSLALWLREEWAGTVNDIRER